MSTEIQHTETLSTSLQYPQSGYKETEYQHKCEVKIPIVLKIPICIEAEIIPKKPICTDKNGHYQPPTPVPVPEG